MKEKRENIPEEELQQATGTPCGDSGEELPPTGEGPPEESDATALLTREHDELNDRYLRLMAEYDNFRKRTQREKEELYASITAATVERFLPTLDNFERAVGFARDSEDFGKGFDLIWTGFQGTLEDLGVAAFGQAGDSFDPALHHAVSHIEDPALGTNVVSLVMQKGYKLGDRVIRYAMVQTAN